MMRRIEERLEAKGWKTAELSRRLGLDRSAFSGWKAGRASPEKHLARIAELLDTSAEYLRGETDDPSPNQDGAPSPEQLRERERALQRLNMIKEDGSLDEERLAALDIIVKSVDVITRKREQE